MSLVCYTTVLGNKPGTRIGIVKYNETGYYPAEGYDYAPDSLATVKARVADLNSRLAVPEDVCESMTYASVFGWDKPVALRAHEYVKADAK